MFFREGRNIMWSLKRLDTTYSTPTKSLGKGQVVTKLKLEGRFRTKSVLFNEIYLFSSCYSIG